jgi:serine/threonine protein kinase
MGVVYEAFDRERQARIALKALPRIDASSLYLFKQEFRALTDVVHPNLATLHELIEYQGTWFFTMEIVDGVDFLRHVRGDQIKQPPTVHEDTTTTFVLDPRGTRPFSDPQTGELTPPDQTPGLHGDFPRSPPLAEPAQFERLRAALAELGDGLLALHAAGKLHRDIKPSNVLVTSAGRVVLLDFGLVQELDGANSAASEEEGIAGTLGYMAPEQAARQALSPAGDWYAVGVIMFQALTGRLPFESRGLQLLADKQKFDPPSVSALAPTAPPDLARLCQELLQRSPEARPSGAQVREQLRGSAVPAGGLRLAYFRDQSIFIGRQRQLAELHAAAELARARTVIVYVHGRSGVGKSWLMQHFLEEVRERDQDAVILTGRCHERESVPYKALDGLMDALSRHLRRRPREETQSLLTPEVTLLARLFPVLRRVPAIAARGMGADIADPHELRRRALVGLRELLARLAGARRLLLHIDDLQWGDLDSVALLNEVLAPPAAPRLCLLFSYRREYVESSACLRALLEPGAHEHTDAMRCELPLESLEPGEAKALAISLLQEGDDSARQAEAEAIARESEGGPYFIRELAHYMRQGRFHAERGNGKITLDEVLGVRVSDLPDSAKKLLEVIAVAGKPIRQREAYQAAELAGGDLAAMRTLHAAHLIRSSGASEKDEIEVYHDRIREIVNRRLPARALEHCHARLAQVLEMARDADPEALAFHFLESGDHQKAGHYYHLAAVQAAQALAFERAVRLYRVSLTTWPPEGEAARTLYAGLARALADAGRAPEAGDAYCAAAQVSRDHQAIELSVEAARHFLLSGHVERGLAELRQVLRAVGLRYPPTRAHALASVFWRGLRLRNHSLAFETQSNFAASDLLRLDVCIMAASSLGYYAMLPSLDFSLRAAQMALATAEPGRVVEALAVLSMIEAAGGGRSRRRTDQLIAAAQQACHLQPSPYLEGLLACIRGQAAYLCGEYRDGLSSSARAEEIFREHCTGRIHNLAFSRTYVLLSHLFLGNLTELARLAPAMVADAQERGDVGFVATHRAFVLPFLQLVQDDAVQASALVQQALTDWGDHESHVVQTLALLGGINASLYAGRPLEAWRAAGGYWQRWKLTSNLLVQSARIEMHFLRARCALAAHAQHRKLWCLRAAGRQARNLERENMPRCLPMANLIRAALAFRQKQENPAIDLLDRCAAEFEREGMALHVAVARRQMGRLLDNQSGQALVDDADAWMIAQGIKNTRRMTELLAPGFES